MLHRMSRASADRVFGGRPVPSAMGATEAAGDPERLLLEAIADGELDQSLAALAGAVDARLRLLHTVRSSTALAQLNVGDEVRVNGRVRPRYLHGAYGTVVELDDQQATIRLHRPVGRFAGEVRCAPLALDRLGGRPVAAA